MKFKSLLSCALVTGSAFLCAHPAEAVEVPAGAVVLVGEDFSKFTTGSFGSPDESADLAWSGISNYTLQPGWNGEELYSAGGTCYIGMAWFFPGTLTTPSFDSTGGEGAYTLVFRACSTGTDELTVSRKISDGTRTNEKVNLTSEWQDFAIEFTGGSEKDMIEFAPLDNPMYIDDIYVYYGGAAGPQRPEGAKLFEPFDSFSEGSEEEPVAYATPGGVIPDEATNEPGWRGNGLFQCGGSAYLGHYGDDSNPKGGYLQTPVLDLSGNGGKFTVTFRAREYDWGFGFGGINVCVYDAATGKPIYNNYADITDEWTDCSIDFTCGIAGCYLQFSASLGEAHIDDIAVIQAVGAIEAPLATGWSKLHDGGFTANWAEAAEADSYLLSVYTASSGKRTYILEDKAVDGLSYDVEGVDITKPCYYVVKAVGANGVSTESNQVTVLGLPEPELLEATDVTTAGFTARWNLVDRATAYLLTVFRSTTVGESGDFALLDEDFAGFEGGTIFEPQEMSTMDIALDSYMSRADWTIHLLAWSDGALGIDNRYVSEYGASWLHSPVCALAGSDGKVSVTLKHYGKMVKRFTVSLRDANGNVLSSRELPAVSDWYEESIVLDGGTAQCYLSIDVPDTEKGVLFLDKLKVSRHVDSGDTVVEPIFGCEVSKPYGADVTSLSYAVKVPSWAENEEYSYTVKSRRVYYDSDFVGYIYSKPESVQKVERPASSGVESVAGSGVSAVCGADGTLTVSAPDDTVTTVFNISGMAVASGTGSFSAVLPAHGVYIVKAGSKTFKIAY